MGLGSAWLTAVVEPTSTDMQLRALSEDPRTRAPALSAEAGRLEGRQFR